MRTEIVGREEERDLLRECLAGALEGRPRLVICRGEPGIGKTRLAEELLAMARAADVSAVSGMAVDESGAPPYWPWRQILRAVAGAIDVPALAARHRLTEDLARLAPDVFAGADLDDIGEPSSEDRFRQFDAVGRLLRQVTVERPLVIVLDDAHWADRASLLLLQHIARTMTDERLLVMVNHRDTEHVHSAIFADLLREPVTIPIQLRGLTPTAVARRLASVVGRDADDDEVEQVYALTGGNPFFVGELGRVLAERYAGGSPAPVTATVLEAIGARLDRLSPESVLLMRSASVVGREFPIAVVAMMVDQPVLNCLGPLDDATLAGLVEPGSEPGTHRFVHALVRDAIEAGIGTPERVALHRAAAEAIEEFHAGDLDQHLFDLARHWAVAAVQGDRARALPWIERAGEQAMHTLAYEDGARLYRLALSVGANELDDDARCRMLVGVAHALHRAGDIAGCIEACLDAAAVARRIGRPDVLAEAALVPEAIGPTPSEVVTRELCEEAIAAVASTEIALQARLKARFAEACVYVAWTRERGLDDYVVAREASERSLALAHECNDDPALEAALRARRLACASPDGLDERVALADQMLALGRRTKNARTQLWAHLWHIDAAFERGDLQRVAAEIEALTWCAEEVRGPFARSEVLRCQSVLAQAQGRFADALRLGEDAFAMLAPVAENHAVIARAGLFHLVGWHTGHVASRSIEVSGLEGATVFDRELLTAGVIVAIADGHLLADAGRLDEAAHIYRALGPVAGWVPSPHAMLCAFAFGINVAMKLGLPDDVATLRSRLAPYGGHHIVSAAGQVAYFGPVDLWIGRAAAFLGDLDAGAADLERAVDMCSVNGAAGFRAEAEVELASVLVRRSRGDDLEHARSVASDAARHAAALDMRKHAELANAVIADLGASSSALTPREHEVADLVAEGMTNRAIAERLVLSERTVQNHVQHVLTKLGFANRSQITAWVVGRRSSKRTE